MLEAHRYRAAAAHLAQRLAQQPAVRYRVAALPAHLRRASLHGQEGIWDPRSLGSSLAGLLVKPPQLDLRHLGGARVSVAERLSHLRELLRASARVSFDEAVGDADRMTVAVTLFALLELHKRGEATWEQAQPFGEITIERRGREAPPAAAPGPASHARSA
jgi:segregation and condensation protein A